MLIKLITNSLYGKKIGKDIEESYECKSEAWMMAEYGERASDYRKINRGNYIVKLNDNAGLEDDLK